jgi:hypothetical protein
MNTLSALLLSAAICGGAQLSSAASFQNLRQDPPSPDPGLQLRGQALLDELSKRSVSYFLRESHPVTGLTRDRAANYGPTNPENHVSSVAATGYSLAAHAIAAKRGWITKKEAVDYSRKTLRFLRDRHAGHKGWFFHWVHWETGARVWNCELSSIDSAILFMNMVMVERALTDPEVSSLTKEILGRVDWTWMLTDGGTKPDSKSFTMGWKPEDGFIKARWDHYCEHMMLYILAFGLSDAITGALWDEWRRPIVDYKGLQLITGGPLFMHQMSHGWVDFKGMRDRLGFDYWVSSRNATLGNRLYVIENPKNFKGYSSRTWGLSACDIPTGYGAKGAPGWIDDDGTLAPAAAVASIIFTPDLSTEAAEGFVKEMPQSWGRYGFTTGINPSQNWRSPDVIGIDIGQMLLCIEAARDRLPYRWTMSHPAVKKGLAKAGLKKTNEGDVTKRPLQIQKRK